jgi:hypothetical protein
MDSYAAMPRLGLGTYIFDAIKHSEALMQNHGNRKAVRMIILLSDGRQVTHVDGAGTRPEPYLAVDWTKANGVPIHTINFQTGSRMKPAAWRLMPAMPQRWMQPSNTSLKSRQHDWHADKARVRIDRPV